MLSGAYEKAFILISFKIERKKQKWSHRCRKQTYGSQGESWVGGVDKLGVGIDLHILLYIKHD